MHIEHVGQSVGVGVHGGAEAALAAADVYLARPGLAPLVQLLEGSGRTLAVIRRNLVFSLGYNAVAVTLAMMGLMHPLVAAILSLVSGDKDLLQLGHATLLRIHMPGEKGNPIAFEPAGRPARARRAKSSTASYRDKLRTGSARSRAGRVSGGTGYSCSP